jgi:hypothetical protein
VLDYSLTILLMNNDALTPAWLKPAALAVLLGTIALVALILALVILGIADPKTLGTLTLDNPESIELSSAAGHTIYQPALDAVHCPCTIEATMRQTSGESTAAYGLWWRTSDVLTIAALNGNAYYAVFDNLSTDLVEWQRYPWLLPQGETNRLRLDLAGDGSATLRINDEIAASFTWNSISPIEIGFYLAPSDTPLTVIIERLRVWSSE